MSFLILISKIISWKWDFIISLPYTFLVEGLWRTCLALRQESWVVPFFAGFYERSLQQIQNARKRLLSWHSTLTPWATAILDSRQDDLTKHMFSGLLLK